MSRSLFSFPFRLCTKSVVATDSLSNSAEVSWRPGRPYTRHALCFQKPGDPNSDETLPAACLLLLDASSGLVGIMVTSSGHRKSWWLSIQVGFVSLSLICQSTCLLWLKSLRFKFLIDLLQKRYQNFSFPNFSPQLLPQLHTLSPESFILSPRTAT